LRWLISPSFSLYFIGASSLEHLLVVFSELIQRRGADDNASSLPALEVLDISQRRLLFPPSREFPPSIEILFPLSLLP